MNNGKKSLIAVFPQPEINVIYGLLLNTKDTLQQIHHSVYKKRRAERI